MKLSQYKSKQRTSTVPPHAKARYHELQDTLDQPEERLAWKGQTRVIVEDMADDMVTSLGEIAARIPGRRVTVNRRRLLTLLEVMDPPAGDPEDDDRITFYVEPKAPLVLKRPGEHWCLLIAPLVAKSNDNTVTTPGEDHQPEGNR